MKTMHQNSNTLSVVALVISCIAVAISLWNFYTLGTWTEYWLSDEGESVASCSEYFDVADGVVAEKLTALGIVPDAENFPAYPDVFFSDEMVRCVAYFSLFDENDTRSDYVYDLESGIELTPEDSVRVVEEFEALYLAS